MDAIGQSPDASIQSFDAAFQMLVTLPITRQRSGLPIRLDR
jgi:hypothetical protein